MVHRGRFGRDCEGWCRAYDAAEAGSAVCEDNDSVKCSVESVESTLSSDDSVKEGEAHAGQLKNNHLSELLPSKGLELLDSLGICRPSPSNSILSRRSVSLFDLCLSLCWMAKSVVEMRTVVGEVAIRWAERFSPRCNTSITTRPCPRKGRPLNVSTSRRSLQPLTWVARQSLDICPGLADPSIKEFRDCLSSCIPPLYTQHDCMIVHVGRRYGITHWGRRGRWRRLLAAPSRTQQHSATAQTDFRGP